MINRFAPIFALALALTLGLATGARAQVPSLPLPAPPAGAGATSGTLFDAMLAIARAVTTNPRAAETATFSYNAAIQQYAIGDYSRSQQSALQALIEAAPRSLPQPPIITPSLPQAAYVPIPHLASTEQADAESFVGLARRALMISCGATAAAAPAGPLQHYEAASKALLARDYAAARTEAQATVDGCAAAGPHP